MKPVKRLKIITAICVIGFIRIVFSFPGVFSPEIKKMGDFFPALFGLIIAGRFIAFIGIWYMKRWGVLLMIVCAFVKFGVNILTNQTGYGMILGALTDVTFITILGFHFKKMDRNF